MTTPQVTTENRTHRPATPDASGQHLSPALLPAWESFTSADRQRLVQTILHAAQHHLTATHGTQPAALGR